MSSAMDSLDAVLSVEEEYASLLTLKMPNDFSKQNMQFTTLDRNQNLSRTDHEHIYAQVTPNGLCHTIQPPPVVRKQDIDLENKAKMLPNKILINNTILVRNPTVALSHANSVPDITRPYPNLVSMCQNNYGSLNTTKDKEQALVKKSEPTTDSSVFSISGRRVVVSSGFNGNGNNNQVNNVKEPGVTPTLPNEWSNKTSQNTESSTKLQVCTDCFSLCLFVPGTVLCILSPWLLVPSYIIPSFSGSHLQTLLWICCIGSSILVFMGCMVGNMVWYRKGKKWKCSLHCGKGPKDYYWGNSLMSKKNVRAVHTV